jgi:hypothetical protein
MSVHLYVCTPVSVHLYVIVCHYCSTYICTPIHFCICMSVELNGFRPECLYVCLYIFVCMYLHVIFTYGISWCSNWRITGMLPPHSSKQAYSIMFQNMLNYQNKLLYQRDYLDNKVKTGRVLSTSLTRLGKIVSCHLAYFLLNQLSPNQAVSTNCLLQVFKGLM